MSVIVDNLAMVQVSLLIPLSLPIFYWIRMNIFSAKGASIKESVIADSEIVVILPMKNEITNVERKISSVIPEISRDILHCAAEASHGKNCCTPHIPS